MTTPRDSQPLGFACHWGPDRNQTWSGSPVRLLAALAAMDDVVDLDVTIPRPARDLLRGVSVRRTNGHWRSAWRHSRAGTALVERRLQQAVRGRDLDAVLQVGDLGRLDVPFFILQDLSYDLLLEHFGEGGVPHFRTLGRATIDRLRRRQHRVYESSAGVIAMSEWLADSVVRAGFPAHLVTVVHPGVNVGPSNPAIPEREHRHGRLLFIGRDFDTKGGPQVVAAFTTLRRARGASVTLTVAGPPRWPLSGAVPDGVRFLGPVSRAEVDLLYETHDLFVMPSHFEGFGIVFAEALARGLPCIGRRACAMPEIFAFSPGGRLIDGDDPLVLAEVIDDALTDDALFEQCAAAAPDVRHYFTWDRAAHQVVAAMRHPRE